MSLGTRLTFVDLWSEAWRSISRSPGRSLLTAMGTILGTAAFVATIGITSTVAHQVSSAFDLRRATTVAVASSPQDTGVSNPLDTWASPSALARIRNLAGVEAAGTRQILPDVSISRGLDIGDGPGQTNVYLLDTDGLAAHAPHVIQGRTFDLGHVARADPMVMLSENIAKELHLHRDGSAVALDGLNYTVIGIFDDAERGAEVLGGVIVPVSTGTSLTGHREAATDIVVKTAPGAAAQVGNQIPLAAAPEGLNLLDINAPPDITTLRQEIEGSVADLSLGLSILTMLIGAISIGSAATSSILLRTPEIGLRRALGARKIHIFTQLLGETTALGLLGGILGSVTGVAALVVLSLANGWVPVIDLRVVALALLGGAAAGCLAGMLPARGAARIEPSAAVAR